MQLSTETHKQINTSSDTEYHSSPPVTQDIIQLNYIDYSHRDSRKSTQNLNQRIQKYSRYSPTDLNNKCIVILRQIPHLYSDQTYKLLAS